MHLVTTKALGFKSLYWFTIHLCVPFFLFLGTMPSGQGKRTDLADLADDIKRGDSLAEIQENHPVTYIRYHSGIDKLIRAQVKPRTTKPTVFVFWGKSRSGKSTLAHEHAKSLCGDSIYIISKNNKQEYSWDDYTGQKAVIFNDFYGGGYPISSLLNLLDRWPNKVRMLYGTREFTSEYIFFTSNVHPRQWYKNVDGDRLVALRNRFDDVCFFPEGDWKYHESFVGLKFGRENNKYFPFFNDVHTNADLILNPPPKIGVENWEQ